MLTGNDSIVLSLSRSIGTPPYAELWKDPLCELSHRFSISMVSAVWGLLPWSNKVDCNTNEPRCEKTCLQGFHSGLTQIELIETFNFGFRKKSNCTIYVMKIKALIS